MKTNIEELKRLAEAATPGPWIKRGYVLGIGCGVDGVTAVAHHTTRADADFISAANPAAVLELIDYIDYLRGKNREHFDACIGCDEELKRVTKQRDELLEALKDAREMVSDWAGYASPYFQEKHDIDGDLKKLDDAIAKVE